MRKSRLTVFDERYDKEFEIIVEVTDKICKLSKYLKENWEDDHAYGKLDVMYVDLAIKNKFLLDEERNYACSVITKELSEKDKEDNILDHVHFEYL